MGGPPEHDEVMDDVLKVSLFSNVLIGRHQYFIIESFFEHLDVLAAKISFNSLSTSLSSHGIQIAKEPNTCSMIQFFSTND